MLSFRLKIFNSQFLWTVSSLPNLNTAIELKTISRILTCLRGQFKKKMGDSKWVKIVVFYYFRLTFGKNAEFR